LVYAKHRRLFAGRKRRGAEWLTVAFNREVYGGTKPALPGCAIYLFVE
jgi:hypothetical protein